MWLPDRVLWSALSGQFGSIVATLHLPKWSLQSGRSWHLGCLTPQYSEAALGGGRSNARYINLLVSRPSSVGSLSQAGQVKVKKLDLHFADAVAKLLVGGQWRHRAGW